MSSQQPGQQLAVAGGGGLMPPPPPRQPKRKPDVVLDEDEWTSSLEAIIERDFFPELPKLESKIAWLQAVRSGDPEQIRQAQLLIAQRRAAMGTSGRPFTGATPYGDGAPLFTPGGTAARVLQGETPYIPGLPQGIPLRQAQRPSTGGAVGGGGGGGEVGAADEEEAEGAAVAAAPPVSLDSFLANHTSEDNASFQQILENMNKRRKMRAEAQLGRPSDPRLLITDGREKTDGFGSTGQQTDTLLGWKYEAKNALYYDSSTRDVVPYSDAELAAMVQGPPKAINHSATRFSKQLAPSDSATPSTTTSAGGAVAASASTAGGDGGGGGAAAGAAARLAAAAGGTRGYDIMATPSFDPGAEDTPIVTWGDIEATPLRIDAEDLPPGPLFDGGPAFFIKEGSRKEQKGHELASKAAASLRRKGTGLRGGTPLVTSTLAAAAAARRQATGGRPGILTGRVGSGRPPTHQQGKPLSEAARRLATSLHKGRVRPDTDLALRASYRAPTPGSVRRGAVGGGATPAASSGGSTWSSHPTPSRAWTPAGRGAGTPAVHATLEEEEARVQALLKARQKDAEGSKQLEEAREAARRGFQQQQQQVGRTAPPAAAAGGGEGQPAAGGGGDLTAGLLNI